MEPSPRSMPILRINIGWPRWVFVLTKYKTGSPFPTSSIWNFTNFQSAKCVSTITCGP